MNISNDASRYTFKAALKDTDYRHVGCPYHRATGTSVNSCYVREYGIKAGGFIYQLLKIVTANFPFVNLKIVGNAYSFYESAVDYWIK